MGRGPPVEPLDIAAIVEHVRHSWYEGEAALRPESGATAPRFTGLDTAERYSGLKAPRHGGEPFEVGPLDRVLVGSGQGRPEFVSPLDAFLKEAGLEWEQMHSRMGRIAARAVETRVIAAAMAGWLDRLQPGAPALASWSMPGEAAGVGLNEAPRGALGHWQRIENGAIGSDQLVVPSTWNFGPRCAAGRPGPVESALAGTPVAEPERPLEILRTVQSFDPSIACAVHVVDPRENRTCAVRFR